MAKRRTKKQKLKSQAKREVVNENLYSFSGLDLKTKPSHSSSPVITSTSARNYSYVITEIKKTAIIMTAILVGQIVLAALIRTNVINLPF